VTLILTVRLRRALGISHKMVVRVLWRRARLKRYRIEGYWASDDPDFETNGAEPVCRCSGARSHPVPIGWSVPESQLPALDSFRYLPSSMVGVVAQPRNDLPTSGALGVAPSTWRIAK
jgi:hypothetical protein